MDTPYRSLFVEPAPVRAGTGHCPWCHAAVQFVTTDRMAVCEACNATFATSIASVTEGRELEAVAVTPLERSLLSRVLLSRAPTRRTFADDLILRAMMVGWALLFTAIRLACKG